FFFFFSSRRRHTRCLSDWSSDVCSSDLSWVSEHSSTSGGSGRATHGTFSTSLTAPRRPAAASSLVAQAIPPAPRSLKPAGIPREIGRASCRERVKDWGGDGAVKENKEEK